MSPSVRNSSQRYLSRVLAITHEKKRTGSKAARLHGDCPDAGRLKVSDGGLAQGWVEVFPELTEDERRLGQLPGFTTERIDQWLETYPAEVLGLPNTTGTPIAPDPTGNIISTPLPRG